MSHPTVRPIREVARGRLQECGKLKIGKLVPTTNGRSTRPASIETFQRSLAGRPSRARHPAGVSSMATAARRNNRKSIRGYVRIYIDNHW